MLKPRQQNLFYEMQKASLLFKLPICTILNKEETSTFQDTACSVTICHLKVTLAGYLMFPLEVGVEGIIPIKLTVCHNFVLIYFYMFAMLCMLPGTSIIKG